LLQNNVASKHNEKLLLKLLVWSHLPFTVMDDDGHTTTVKNGASFSYRPKLAFRPYFSPHFSPSPVRFGGVLVDIVRYTKLLT